MITTGIIREINLSSANHKNNRYKVELNIFQIPGDTNKDAYTFEANCMVASGFSSVYNVGDKVFVGFLNNDKSFPIILGKIYQGISDDYRGYGALTDLKVKNSVALPNDITIGSYDYDDLDITFRKISLLSIQQINQLVTLLASTPLTEEHLKSINAAAEQMNNAINADLNALSTTVTEGLYYAKQSIAAINSSIDTINGNIKDVNDEIGYPKEIDGNGNIVKEAEGMYAEIDAAVSAAEESLQGMIDAEANELNGIIKTVEALASAKLAGVSASDKSIAITTSKTTEQDKPESITSEIAVQLSSDTNNALELDETEATPGLKVILPNYSITKLDTPNANASASYQFTINNEGVGEVIDIPKDKSVTSGEVVDISEGESKCTYIKLNLENVDNPLYINASKLYVTSGSVTGDAIAVTVSDDHKVTASITDGTITLAKLTTEVQDAINKAHTHDNKEVLDNISAERVNAWDAAEQKANKYTDDEITELVTELDLDNKISALSTKIESNTNAINILNDDAETPGSVDNKIANAITNDTFINTISNKVSGSVTNIYAVGFDANGGYGEMTPQVVIGNKYILPDCTFSKDGNEFNGWCSTPLPTTIIEEAEGEGDEVIDNSGCIYQYGDEYEINSNVIFYAQWKEKVVELPEE